MIYNEASSDYTSKLATMIIMICMEEEWVQQAGPERSNLKTCVGVYAHVLFLQIYNKII